MKTFPPYPAILLKQGYKWVSIKQGMDRFNNIKGCSVSKVPDSSFAAGFLQFDQEDSM